MARLREAVEKGDAPAIKIYTSAWVDACKCLKVLEDWARGLDTEERSKAENAQIEKEISHSRHGRAGGESAGRPEFGLRKKCFLIGTSDEFTG